MHVHLHLRQTRRSPFRGTVSKHLPTEIHRVQTLKKMAGLILRKGFGGSS
jgi:hypothetical protein